MTVSPDELQAKLATTAAPASDLQPVPIAVVTRPATVDTRTNCLPGTTDVSDARSLLPELRYASLNSNRHPPAVKHFDQTRRAKLVVANSCTEQRCRSSCHASSACGAQLSKPAARVRSVQLSRGGSELPRGFKISAFCQFSASVVQCPWLRIS